MNVLSFGEILWDVYPDKKFLGGAPLNFAAHLAKHGEEAYMLSTLGEDDLGREALAQVRRWNVFTDYVSVCDKKQTGRCQVTLDENSVPTYDLLQDVAYDYISGQAVTDAFDVLYFGTLALRSAYNQHTVKQMLESGCFQEVFVDVNIRPPFYTRDTVRFAVQNATILKISLEELPVVCAALGMADLADYQTFAKALAHTYDRLNCLIITLGADGAYVLDCNHHREYACGSANVEVKSTVGAGDSFSAAFLSEYLRGSDLQTCLEHAVKIAGYVVSQFDAVPDYCVEDFR